MKLDSINNKTRELLIKLSNNPDFPSNFYLTGGTALALHLGHRDSIDLDFFSFANFNETSLSENIAKITPIEDSQLDRGTLNTYSNGVKLQFLHYPYKLLKPCTKLNNINISDIYDIAVNKLVTVSSRGSKKDFIDLYFLLGKYSLTEIFAGVSTKFSNSKYDQGHIIKSLTYFDEADSQPMPKMNADFDWEQAKSQLIKIATNFIF